MSNPSHLIFTIFSIFLLSCHNHHDHHHHEEEDASLLFTSYGAALELFVESDPFVKGEVAELLIHLTELQRFKPVSGAKVRLFRADLPESNARAIEISPGIYKARYNPDVAGVGSLVFEIEWPDGKEDHHWEISIFEIPFEATDHAHKLEIHHPNAVVFTKEHSWGIEFATGIVVSEHFGEVIKTVGRIKPALQDELVIGVRSSGVLEYKSGIYAGTKLKAGQLLAVVNPHGFADGNIALQFTEARNNFNRLKADYERASLLFEKKIKSEKEYLQAKNELDNARAVFENLQKVFHEAGEQVKSPVDGFVKEVLAANGQHLVQGQSLVVVAKQTRFNLMADVPARYFEALQRIETINVFDKGIVYSLDELGGKLLSVGNRVGDHNHLIPVYLEIDRNANIFPGVPVDMFIKTTSEKALLVVPRTAVTEESGTFFVYAQLHPELFEKRQVKLGATDGFSYEIIDGLAAGERIVSKGAALVKASAAVGQVDPHAGHVH